MMCSILQRLFFGLAMFWAIHAVAADHFKAEQTLAPTVSGDPRVRDHYGATVCIENGFLFVAAPSACPDGKQAGGVVYVYKQLKDKWVLSQIISAGSAGDGLGLQMEVKDNLLFISSGTTPLSPMPDNIRSNQPFCGAVQIYHLNRRIEEGPQLWVPLQTLDRNFPGLENLTRSSRLGVDPFEPAFSAQQGASFGMQMSFDLENRLLLVGAPYQRGLDAEGKPIINVGAVYAFKMNHHGQFKLLQKITNPDGLFANDTFGSQVCVNGHYALISNAAVYKTPRLDSNSTVYVYHYRKKQWHCIQKLMGDQKKPTAVDSPVLGNVKVGDGFGSSLAMCGDWALIGAGLESKGPGLPLSGAAYFYKLKQKDNQWTYVFKQKVVSDDPTTQGTALLHVVLRDDTALLSDPCRTGPKGEPCQGGILQFKRDGNKWKKDTTLYDPKGSAYSFFGFGLNRDKKRIIGGTATYVAPYLFHQVGNPALAPQFPVKKNRVVIFERK